MHIDTNCVGKTDGVTPLQPATPVLSIRLTSVALLLKSVIQRWLQRLATGASTAAFYSTVGCKPCESFNVSESVFSIDHNYYPHDIASRIARSNRKIFSNSVG